MCVPLIDVSRSPERVDFARLRACGIHGVVARATSGSRPDDRFLGHARGCARASLPLGTSALFHPDADGTVQALILWDRVVRAGGSCFEVVECGAWWDTSRSVTPTAATSPKEYEAELARFVAEVTRLSGRRPIISTSAGFWDHYVQSPAFTYLDCMVSSHRLHAMYSDDWTLTPPRSYSVRRSTDAADVDTCWAAWRFPADGTALGRLFGAEGLDIDLAIVEAAAWRRWVGQGPWLARADDRPLLFVRRGGDA